MTADIQIKQGDGPQLPMTFRGARLEMYLVERFINEPERIAIHIFCGAGGHVQSAFPVAGRILAEVTK